MINRLELQGYHHKQISQSKSSLHMTAFIQYLVSILIAFSQPKGNAGFLPLEELTIDST